jgi:hypothetical protein
MNVASKLLALSAAGAFANPGIAKIFDSYTSPLYRLRMTTR